MAEIAGVESRLPRQQGLKPGYAVIQVDRDILVESRLPRQQGLKLDI